MIQQALLSLEEALQQSYPIRILRHEEYQENNTHYIRLALQADRKTIRVLDSLTTKFSGYRGNLGKFYITIKTKINEQREKEYYLCIQQHPTLDSRKKRDTKLERMIKKFRKELQHPCLN